MNRPCTVLFSLVLAVPVAAQACGKGETLLKNDALPAVPSGSYTFGIVPGLCIGEAAMSVFNAGGPCKVKAVSVFYGHKFGTNGVKAAVDVEIYDGVTFAANGNATLGKQLFKLSSGSTNLQIQSTGLNTYTLPKPVSVPSGRPVIGFRMITTLSGGSCSAGYDTNFCVDAVNTCTKGINILDAPTQFGPVDPAVYKFGGLIPLCPTYIRGSWIIRACVEPDVSVSWTGNATPGGVLSFTFNAPGQGGNNYYLVLSGGIKTGWQSPWGKLPLDRDPIFDCFLAACSSTLIGRTGTFNSSGKAFGGMLIPNAPILKNSGLTLYACFVTFKAPNFAPWISVSSVSRPIVIN